MPPEAIFEWGITLLVFALVVGVLALMPWKAPTAPKYEPSEQLPEATDSQAILDAINAIERCIDWRKGNTDSNLILDDVKWQLWKRAKAEYGVIPVWNERTKRWVEFRLIDTMRWS